MSNDDTYLINPAKRYLSIGNYFNNNYYNHTIIFISIRTYILGFDFGGTPKELMNNPFIKIVGNSYVPFTFGEKFATIL